MKHIKKCLILIITLVYLVQIGGSIEECDSPLEPSDVPCNVVSTYDYTGDCSEHTATIYNSTPALLQTRTWGNYSPTNRCNITFNETQRGSYLINSSEGSTASIIVEGTKMEFLRLGIFFGLFAITLLFIAFMHIFKEDVGSSIAYGFFALGISVIASGMIFFGFEAINTTGLTLPFNVNLLIALIFALLGFYGAWFSTSLLIVVRRKRAEQRSMDEFRAF